MPALRSLHSNVNKDLDPHAPPCLLPLGFPRSLWLIFFVLSVTLDFALGLTWLVTSTGQGLVELGLAGLATSPVSLLPPAFGNSESDGYVF